MPTISDLVAKHSKVPGDIRVRRKSWACDAWFRPFYGVDDVTWRGLSDANIDVVRDGDFTDFELYVEPKPKVKRWLWADFTCGRFFATNTFYSEIEAAENLSSRRVKLHFSVVEFEE